MMTGNSPHGPWYQNVLQELDPYPRATNTHNSANERSSSKSVQERKDLVAAVL